MTWRIAILLAIASAALPLHGQEVNSYEFLATASNFCTQLRNALPVRREVSQSLMDRVRKPGPVQTQPWFLAKRGILAVPRETEGAAVPQNFYVEGSVRQRDQAARNGRLLNIGEPVWMTGSSCSTARIDLSRNRGVTINLDFVTHNSLETIRNGDAYLTPFVFQLRLSLEELLGLPENAVAPFIEALLSSQPNGSKASRTVRLGQSRAEVEQNFGMPDRIADLGAKVVYSYRDLKVTFLNGKVSDVE